jgi:hypothetical protein
MEAHNHLIDGHPPVVKVCLVLLLCVSVTAAQRQWSNIPLDNPFTSFNAVPVSELKVSGKVITSIENGDFVHPTFSPDGKLLAYSKVLVHGDFENTEVRLYNLNTRKTSVLLDSKRAKRYATYKAFVAEMDWKNPRRLEVVIGDGDMDSTRLIFDPLTRRLLREKHEGYDETGVPPIPPIYEEAHQRAVLLFPTFPREVLHGALVSSALVIPDKGIVLQKNYLGHDNNIWFLDFQNKAIKSLINLSEDSAGAYAGGISFKSSIIILLFHKPKTYLFLYRDGKIKELGEINSTGFNQVEVKHRSMNRIVFLVRTHEAYERGDNSLFIFDGEQLFRVREHAELYDAAIDLRGQRVAYCYWEGDKRHIVVKELNLDKSRLDNVRKSVNY